MAAGRKTGGRQKGTRNKVTQDQQAAVIASGLAPLDYMLKVMRDDEAPRERRDDMAKAAAPYVHPRLQSTAVTGADGGPLKVEVVRFGNSPHSRK